MIDIAERVGFRTLTMEVVICPIHGKTWANHSGKTKDGARTICCGDKLTVSEHPTKHGGGGGSSFHKVSNVTRKPRWKEAKIVDGSFCITCWGAGVRAKLTPQGMAVEVPCSECRGSGRPTP